MASSSHSHQTPKSCNITREHSIREEEEDQKVSKVREEEKEEEEEEGWLKLGLGLGCGTSSSSCSAKIAGHGSNYNPVLDSPSPSYAPPFSSQSALPSRNYQIGLGLGFERGSGLGPKDNEGYYSDQCNYYHCYHHNNHNNDDDNGMVPLWPSWQIDSQPLPCDSHHYYNWATSSHHSGLWFTLRSSTNRRGEALPQIPKAYIRVRDENVTIFMVKKYLVTKLGLSNEAEIDISCMGQSLSHMQTLKQVRDTVWLPRVVESVNSTTLSLGISHDMSTNYLMSLLYRKHCILN